ncbi:hypothetical protein HCA58_18800 [Micromonospora sp. HNM0581]|uniref:hypothetical protein n=1 Tax=Micromonospora sp. HNM0581 TaxID=2716341 RepID=UPI00146EA60C|nr:hypothetical protein [Micromonospora sp. HNM0581]NLU80383.1 hypothetical protein [Micromonospora sp. HNM0581]
MTTRQDAQANGMGWLGWSWSGNSGGVEADRHATQVAGSSCGPGHRMRHVTL